MTGLGAVTGKVSVLTAVVAPISAGVAARTVVGPSSGTTLVLAGVVLLALSLGNYFRQLGHLLPKGSQVVVLLWRGHSSLGVAAPLFLLGGLGWLSGLLLGLAGSSAGVKATLA